MCCTGGVGFKVFPIEEDPTALKAFECGVLVNSLETLLPDNVAVYRRNKIE
jgi:hypothetical protein